MIGWLSAWATAVPPPEIRISAKLPDLVSVAPDPDPPDTGLSFLGWVQVKASMSDIVTQDPLVVGQIVGVLGGTNGTEVLASGPPALFVEQRAVGFFRYAPPVLDGRVALNSAFEVDFAWGDRSYGTGGDTGGGYGADQVNLQTRRLYVTASPLQGPHHHLDVHVGLQFLSDGVADPMSSPADDVLRSGGRLMFFGSEASGIAAYGRWHTDWGDRLSYRAGAFLLHEQGLGRPDDVGLHVLDVAVRPIQGLVLGAHGWWLRDRSGGAVGALGVGVASALAERQGAVRLDLEALGVDPSPDLDADVFYAGLDAGYNARLDEGPIGITGVAMLDAGTQRGAEIPNQRVIGGVVDVEARARFAAGSGSVVRAEVLWTSADADGDGEGAVVTGNHYGIAGAGTATHGTLLLFPDPFSVNRQVGSVYDVTNQGDGLLAVTGGVGYDLVPSRINAGIGGGWARGTSGTVGTEINGRIAAEAVLGFEVGLQGAVVLGGDTARAPWIVYASLDWVVF